MQTQNACACVCACVHELVGMLMLSCCVRVLVLACVCTKTRVFVSLHVHVVERRNTRRPTHNFLPQQKRVRVYLGVRVLRVLVLACVYTKRE